MARRVWWLPMLAVLPIPAIVGFVAVWWFAWPWVLSPPVRCELARTELCQLTLHAEWPWRNPRPDSIVVHDAPAEWRSANIWILANAEWAADVDEAFDPVFEAACYRTQGGATCYMGDPPGQ